MSDANLDLSHSDQPRRWMITRSEPHWHGTSRGGREATDLSVSDPHWLIEAGTRVEVMLVSDYERDVIRLAQEAASLKSTLNGVRRAVAEAEQLLSPGMRAGTAEAKAILKNALA